MKTLARPTTTATNSIIELTAAALPTQHQLGALPFQDLTRKNGLVTPGRRRNLADPCDRLAGGLRSRAHTAGMTPALSGSTDTDGLPSRARAGAFFV